jgi:hypothetical protein
MNISVFLSNKAHAKITTEMRPTHSYEKKQRSNVEIAEEGVRE